MSKFEEVTPCNFNPMWAPKLSDEARKAVNAAFDAMSTWRIYGLRGPWENHPVHPRADLLPCRCAAIHPSA